MAQGNLPFETTTIGGIHVAIFDNGDDKPLGVMLSKSGGRIVIRPGHAKRLREIADWIEQQKEDYRPSKA